MKDIFKDYLFTKHIFVNDCSKEKDEIDRGYTFFSLAKLFAIKITSGQELLNSDMIKCAEKNLGIHVPKPFYVGFPESVKKLTDDQLFIEQIFNYFLTYDLGFFDIELHSVYNEITERLPFNENYEIKEFSVVTEIKAQELLFEYVDSLLKSTRPLNDAQYELVKEYVTEYEYDLSAVASKDTTVKLLADTGNIDFADFLALSDVIRLVDYINYIRYNNLNINKLNLKNKDRKLIASVMDRILESGYCDIKTCYEKRKTWCGLLHHIHYKPKNETAEKFLHSMRSGENQSVCSEFEAYMNEKNIKNAFDCLVKGKGHSAVLRNLNYILSRCQNISEVQYILDNIEGKNAIVLIQLLMQYANYKDSSKRCFKFTKYNRLRLHYETPEEALKRKSQIPAFIVSELEAFLRGKLKDIYAEKLGKVYIDPAMKNIALPLQENVSMGGFGTLPKGSRIHIEDGKKIRAFTYWEKVYDIDLSAIGIDADGIQHEFSWRTMYYSQSDAIAFSGDVTSGYNGGSEYYDIDLAKVKELYPNIRYLVLCNNVYSRIPFKKCLCKAGFMLRDTIDTGEIFEPKTVKSSFTINCDSTFAYLFGVDLEKNDFVWLNAARHSSTTVAGITQVGFLLDYFNATDVLNMYDLFSMLATELTDDPQLADVVVTDENVDVKDGAEVIRSYDFEKVLAYMNVKP